MIIGPKSLIKTIHKFCLTIDHFDHSYSRDHINLSSRGFTGFLSSNRSISESFSSQSKPSVNPLTCSITTLPSITYATLMPNSCLHHSGPSINPEATEHFHSCPIPLELSQNTSQTPPICPFSILCL